MSLTIQTKDLVKVYGSRTVVNKVSFNVKQGEIVGLLGPNGAGKTTTISILCGLFPPSSGKVLIDGKDLHKELPSIKNIIGIVPQDIALYPTLSARENLAFYGSMYGWIKCNVLRNNTDDIFNRW